MFFGALGARIESCDEKRALTLSKPDRETGPIIAI